MGAACAELSVAAIVERMSPRTGRPRAAEPRADVVRYRVTAAELALLREAAGGDEPNLWAREQALAAAKRVLARRRREAAAG